MTEVKLTNARVFGVVIPILIQHGKCEKLPAFITDKDMYDLACTFQGMGWIVSYRCEMDDAYNGMGLWWIDILRERDAD